MKNDKIFCEPELLSVIESTYMSLTTSQPRKVETFSHIDEKKDNKHATESNLRALTFESICNGFLYT